MIYRPDAKNNITLNSGDNKCIYDYQLNIIFYLWKLSFEYNLWFIILLITIKTLFYMAPQCIYDSQFQNKKMQLKSYASIIVSWI